ncbi:unnamed protein product [Paramecium pentaurelia]|uniref:G domain-containing protein n=1 Tax=Paramecium pentaurelia TaxID=43138 RepID=A0A8S1V9J2_9CILI|nr:unnamed protein product [Paramecium pentaurelia]
MQQAQKKSCCQKFKELFIKPQNPQGQIVENKPFISGPKPVVQTEWPIIEEQFISKIGSEERKKLFIELLKKNHIVTIEQLMLSFQDSKVSFIGRRCSPAEFFILQQIYYNYNTQQKNLKWEYESAKLLSNEDTQILQQKPEKKVKNILLVGTTGQGKTTLINSFYNYIQKTKLDDGVRYLVINDDRLNQTGKSVTRNVDQYKMKIDDDLIFNFIDTPGLGDTEGYSRDQAIIDQISDQLKKLHEKNERIHQVIIVSQLSTSYIVDNSHTLQQLALLNVLKLFGIDMAYHYIHALTFSDFTSIHRHNFENQQSIFYVLSQKDCLMQTQNISQNNITQSSPTVNEKKLLLSDNQMNEIPKEYCQFQNSVYFSKKSDIISNIQYKKNEENYNKFVKKISSDEGFTLDTTIQVIHERNRLKHQIENLGQELQLRMKIDRIVQSNITKINNYDQIAQENEKFFYFEFETKIEKINCPDRIFMTNCNTCQKTCHKNCSVSNENLRTCNVMIQVESNKYICESCQHSVEEHKNEKFQKEYDEMKAELDRALSQKEILNQLLQKEKKKEEENDMKIQVILDDLRNCFNILFSSALYKLDLKEKSLKNFLYRYYKCFSNQLEKYFNQNVDILATRRLLQDMPLNEQTTIFRLRTEQFQQVQ